MALYKYKARDNTGEVIWGTINADSDSDIAEILYDRGLTVIEIRDITAKKEYISKFQYLLSPITPKELVMFFQQLHILIKGGMPLYESLTAIYNQMNNRRLKKLLKSIIKDVESGSSLSAAISKYPWIFSQFITNMIYIGENAGTLDESLFRINKFIQDEMEVKSRVKNALIYPLTVLFLGLGLTIFIIVYLIPKFVDVFIKANIKLPLPTRILINISDFVTQYYIGIIIFIFSIIISYFLIKMTVLGRKIFFHIKINIPYFGQLIKKSIVYKFLRTAGTLLQSGMPMFDTLNICKSSSENITIKEELNEIITRVKEGESLGKSMENTLFFPDIVIQLITSSEESGHLDKTLIDLAEYYENQVWESIKQLTKVIEPVLLVFIALIIVFIAASLLLPLFNMARAIRMSTR